MTAIARPDQGRQACGWTEYPFWKCSQGIAYDLRLDPHRDLAAPPVPNFCPGCGERIGF